MSRRRHVTEQLGPRQDTPLEHARLEGGDLLVGHQDIDTEIDRAAAGRLLELLPADERAAADVAGNKPAPRGFGVRARDRGNRNAQVVGHVTVRRKPRASAKAPLLDVFVDRVSDGGGRPAPAVPRDSAATLSWRNVGIDDQTMQASAD